MKSYNDHNKGNSEDSSRFQKSLGIGRGQEPAKTGFKQPVRKWDAACKWCRGAGKIRGLRGNWEPCQGCQA